MFSVFGWRARAALERTGGRARVIARMRESTWLAADGDVVWLGRPGSTLHPRAILEFERDGDVANRGDGDVVQIDVGGAREWRPRTAPLDADGARRLVEGAARLRADLRAVGPVDGFAYLLGGAAPAAPAGAPAPRGVLVDVMARAAPSVRALGAACAADRAADAVAPAIALIGLGPGLTPSGDDFVGGVLFARRLLGMAGIADRDRWGATADLVRERAQALTHPISAALLGDLLDGESHAPLHELVDALVTHADPRPAARALVRLGHSSGWDILAGFLVGLTAR